MELERLTSNHIQRGMIIISYEVPAMIHIGRVHSEVKKYPPVQALLTGLFAEFDILQAHQHARAGDLIWKTYFYGNRDAPTDPGVFKWPDRAMNLTFDLAERSLAMGRTGWLVHVEVRHPRGPVLVLGTRPEL